MLAVRYELYRVKCLYRVKLR